MKTKIKIILLISMLAGGTDILQGVSAQGVSVSFQVFYDELSPYGTWVNNNDYGYVWIPDVSPGFTPYGTNGYWVFTEAGWTWVSDYPWGWAPFHYGRWFYDPFYGPMWVPDSQWGPGWVTWRRSSGYYGWAPIEPGVSLHVAYSSGYNPSSQHWRFVKEHDFGQRNISNYYVNTSSNVTIINHSTVINNTVINKSRNESYHAGPDRKEVEKLAGSPITPVAIKENSKPGHSLSNGELQIYRPQVQKKSSTGSKAAPAKVASLKDLKPAAHPNVEAEPKRENLPEKQQQQTKPKRDIEPGTQDKAKPQREGQPVKQEQPMPLRESQPANQQQPAPIREVQPEKQKQPIKEGQPAKQKKRKDSPAGKSPSKQK